jgi:integrase
MQTVWERVRIKANLPDVRIHDLRHTFASLLVSGGMTLPMIGRLLGRKQVQRPHTGMRTYSTIRFVRARSCGRNAKAEASLG